MLRTLVLTIAIAALSGSTAIAQTIRTPVPAEPAGVLLVKHDKDDNGDNGHGRKLGHYKNRSTGDDSNDDNGTRATRRSNRDGTTTTTTTTTTRRSRTNQAPYYYGAPGYGTSYPAPYYDYYQPPYYRGY
jgi:hypothetical protein